MKDNRVAFTWKDYKHGAAQRTMTLEGPEFIRRFLLHVLPDGFQHMRSYGFLGNRYREARLDLCRRLLSASKPVAREAKDTEDYRDRYERLTGQSLRDCPLCGRGHMFCIETFAAGAYPRAAPPDTS